MNNTIQQTIDYIIDFLAGFPISQLGIVHYGRIENAPRNANIVIISAVNNLNIEQLPNVPFDSIDNTPILFGSTKIERENSKIIVYADIIASSFFLLSRYEEILKPNDRDEYSRFRAAYSIIFQQGYGSRPLVDEYGILFRKWLREIGIDVPVEKKGFSKIYLTHDVDSPFRFAQFSYVIKQLIKKILKMNHIGHSITQFFNEKKDDYYTFEKLFFYDSIIKKSSVPATSIYFLMSAGSRLFKHYYYNIFSFKVNRMIKHLLSSGAELGIHISFEGGKNTSLIKSEIKSFRKKIPSRNLLSRHHYLRWCEPEDIVYMEQAGINEDFTLSYADCIGFRVGTCHPYRFINPRTKKLTNVITHPLEIMECSLSSIEYMQLDYEEAFEQCKALISQVYNHNGELVLLWHNTEFIGLNYQEKLYNAVLEYIKGIIK